jgi:bifunctional non-homologous end joining protein LigD
MPAVLPTSSRRGKTRKTRPPRAQPVLWPEDQAEAELQVDGRALKLTNLQKPFWPELGITKGDLLRYYAEVSPWLLPHLRDRAMVMKRYPDGAHGKFFFQKRAPEHRPEWIDICSIKHASANVVDFPIVRDLASLLWLVNLGCIDLNPWYARCGDVQRPDYLHFDLDPTLGASWEQVSETALAVHTALDALKMPNLAKTTGSRGIHIYVPIVFGPTQKEVWSFAKQFAQTMASLHPKLITAEYRIAKRPKKQVLLDYNQNAWGRTLASVYSVRPKPEAPVSTPVTWEEIKRAVQIADFTVRTVPDRLRKIGDLWHPLVQARGRFPLEKVLP